MRRPGGAQAAPKRREKNIKDRKKRKHEFQLQLAKIIIRKQKRIIKITSASDPEHYKQLKILHQQGKSRTTKITAKTL